MPIYTNLLKEKLIMQSVLKGVLIKESYYLMFALTQTARFARKAVLMSIALFVQKKFTKVKIYSL